MKKAHLILAVIACAGPTAQAQDLSCQQTLEALYTPRPDYPSSEQAKTYLQGTSYIHVFVEGSVSVEFTVNRDSTVSGARIVQSEYHTVGRDSHEPGYFDGFLEMNVLPAVEMWRFSPIAEPCMYQFTFRWKFDAD